MPIVVTPPLPGTDIGPGFHLDLQSDFIGPLPLGSKFTVEIFAVPSGQPERLIWQGSKPTQSPFYVAFPIMEAPTELKTEATPHDGDTVSVLVNLSTPSGVVDSGPASLAWRTTQGVGQQIAERTGGQGGLTAEQATQLADTANSSVLDQLVDALLVQEVTSGPSPGPVRVTLGQPVWGVIVRMDTVPLEIPPKTPDEDYWVITLAVVRVYRGTDLWLRVPVHTSSRIVPFLGEGIIGAVAKVFTNLTVLDLTLEVTFLNGLTGRVYLMNFP